MMLTSLKTSMSKFVSSGWKKVENDGHVIQIRSQPLSMGGYGYVMIINVVLHPRL